MCDYLSVLSIATGIKRTTFLPKQVPNPRMNFTGFKPMLAKGFVLAPNKDLAVSAPYHYENIPLLECQTFPPKPFLFAPRALLQTVVNRYYFICPNGRDGVRTFL